MWEHQGICRKKNFQLTDEVMEDVVVAESVGKKGRKETDQGSCANIGEGEVTSSSWSPMQK